MIDPDEVLVNIPVCFGNPVSFLNWLGDSVGIAFLRLMILGTRRFEHVCTAFYALPLLMILGIRCFEHVCYLDMDLSIISGDVIICSLRSSQSVSFFYFIFLFFVSIHLWINFL